jgi:hypothetical protein
VFLVVPPYSNLACFWQLVKKNIAAIADGAKLLIALRKDCVFIKKVLKVKKFFCEVQRCIKARQINGAKFVGNKPLFVETKIAFYVIA